MEYYLDDTLDLDECARAHGLLDNFEFESDDSDSGRSELDEKYLENRLELEDDCEGNTKLIKVDLSSLTLADNDESNDFEEIGHRATQKIKKTRNHFPSYAMAAAAPSTITANRFGALEPLSDEEKIVDEDKLDSVTNVTASVIGAELSKDSLQLPIDDNWQTVSYKKSSKNTVCERISYKKCSKNTVSERSNCKKNTPLSKPFDGKKSTVQQNISKKPGIHLEKKHTEKQQPKLSNQSTKDQKKQHTKEQQENVANKSGIDQKKKHTETVQQKQPTKNHKKKLTKMQQQKVSEKSGVNQKVKEPQKNFHDKLTHTIDDKKKHEHAKNVEATVGTELDVYLQGGENKKTLEQHDLYMCKQCMDFISNEKERYSDDMFNFFNLEREIKKELVTRIRARSRIKQEEKRRGSIERRIRYFLQSITNFFLRLFGRAPYHDGVYQIEYNLEPLVSLAWSELEACVVPNRCTLQPLIVDID